MPAAGTGTGTAQIGVTGLAVMGRNLARNFARHGYTVALHNRTAARTRALVADFGHEGPSSPPRPQPTSSPRSNALAGSSSWSRPASPPTR
ncbi:NAD(P)-binding domain-containing protein [Streptacidiphilus monticola]